MVAAKGFSHAARAWAAGLRISGTAPGAGDKLSRTPRIAPVLFPRRCDERIRVDAISAERYRWGMIE
jgi:hypothetical protein